MPFGVAFEVNGDKFEFSQEAMRCAEDLQRAWAELCGLLDRGSERISGAKGCLKSLKWLRLALGSCGT